MKKFAMNVALVALLAGVAGFSTPSRAETGQVAVVFTKGGFILGVGGGEGGAQAGEVGGVGGGSGVGDRRDADEGRLLELGPAGAEAVLEGGRGLA